MAARRKKRFADADEDLLGPKRARVPFSFVLDELASLGPYTKPMFGCVAVYVGEKIVFILRDRPVRRDDNGVWIATTREHHDSLRSELSGLRSIGVLAGGGETGWQNLPAEHPDFEDAVLRACALVRAGDPRIGKVPSRTLPRRTPPSGAVPPKGPPRRGPPAKGPPTLGPPRRTARKKPRR
jgi:hypothetical protein